YSITSGAFAESRGTLDFSSNSYNTTWANSNYDALQLSVEKRLGAFRILGSYTWSKSIDNSSNWNDEQMNPFNHRISRSLSAFDMAHNFVASYSYDLPFAKIAGGPSAKKILGGWQLSGIGRLTTG